MTPEKRLALAIKNSNQTQRAIAERAGVGLSTVQNYAAESISFNQVYTVAKVCRVVGLDFYDLYEDLIGRKSEYYKTIEDLTYRIEDWFYDRNLHSQEPSNQFLKVAEEVGELGGALARQDKDLIEDALGDVFVTLIGISMQTDIDFTGAVQTAYDEIKDRKGRLVGGVFVKDE